MNDRLHCLEWLDDRGFVGSIRVDLCILEVGGSCSETGNTSSNIASAALIAAMVFCRASSGDTMVLVAWRLEKHRAGILGTLFGQLVSIFIV
jgi:hypothetical protein